VAKAREIPGIGPDVRFRDAAAAAVAVRAEEVFQFGEGVLDTSDIERVHDMRVATRRLRAVMEIFAPCFPKAEHRQALKEVKALADALGTRRDPDVGIEELEHLAGELPAADRPGLESLVAELAEDQEDGNANLGRVFAEVERNGLRERLLELAEEARTS
jgi:CHAD domain-containing protein